jgi:hypothetical protein
MSSKRRDIFVEKLVQQKYFSASSLKFATLSIRRIRGKGAGLLQAYKLRALAHFRRCDSMRQRDAVVAQLSQSGRSCL